MKSLFSREQVDSNGSFQEHHRLREQHVEEFGFNRAPRSLTAQTDDGLNAFIASVGQERLQELATGETSGGMPPQVLPMEESKLDQNLDFAIDSLISYFKSGQFGEFECPFKDYKKQPIVCRYAAFLPPNNVPIKRVLHYQVYKQSLLIKSAKDIQVLPLALQQSYGLRNQLPNAKKCVKKLVSYGKL